MEGKRQPRLECVAGGVERGCRGLLAGGFEQEQKEERQRNSTQETSKGFLTPDGVTLRTTKRIVAPWRPINGCWHHPLSRAQAGKDNLRCKKQTFSWQECAGEKGQVGAE